MRSASILAIAQISGDAFLKKQIGFFGGTFDPIHLGHLNLAIELLEKAKLDEVLFCPALCSPFKQTSPPLARPEERFEMIRRTIEGVAGLAVTSVEIERGAPSYTIDTVRLLQTPSTSYRLILTSDALLRFSEWKEPEALLQLAPPLIGSRVPFPKPKGLFAHYFQQSFVETRLFDLSSTEIRRRLADNLYCGHLVAPKALDYIHHNRLYCKA